MHTRAKPKAALQTSLSFVNKVSDSLPLLAYRHHHTQMVWNGASSHKIDYVAQAYDILNLKEYKHSII